MTTMLEIKDAVNKALGIGTVMSLDDLPQKCESISTGVPSLDQALGIGGLPLGRLMELYGPEMSGKSTVLLHTCAYCQIVLKRPILYLDFENAFDRSYALALGVDLGSEMFALSQPDDLEQGMDIAETYVVNNVVGLIVVDSLAAMMPRAELYDAKGKERGFGDKTPLAAQGKAMAEALRRLTPKISKSNVCMCFINQTRIDLKAAQRGFTVTTTPGSGTLKFYASLRVEFKKRDTIKGKVIDSISSELVDGPVGTVVEAKIVKNKLAPPFVTCRFVLSFGKGVSQIMTDCYLAMERGVIEKLAAGYYMIPVAEGCDMEKVRGMINVHSYYEQSSSASEYLNNLLYPKIESASVINDLTESEV